MTELPEAVVLEGGQEDLGTLRAFVVRACSAAGVSRANAFALRLAAEEAFINVITHRAGAKPRGPVRNQLGSRFPTLPT